MLETKLSPYLGIISCIVRIFPFHYNNYVQNFNIRKTLEKYNIYNNRLQNTYLYVMMRCSQKNVILNVFFFYSSFYKVLYQSINESMNQLISIYQSINGKTHFCFS